MKLAADVGRNSQLQGGQSDAFDTVIMNTKIENCTASAVTGAQNSLLSTEQCTPTVENDNHINFVRFDLVIQTIALELGYVFHS